MEHKTQYETVSVNAHDGQHISYMKMTDNVFIHIAAWGIFFGAPLFFMGQGNFSWSVFLMFIPVPVCFMIVFYANYFYLVDHFLFEGRKKEFLLINLFLILGAALLIHFWHEFSVSLQMLENQRPMGHLKPPGQNPPPEEKTMLPIFLFIIRDVISLILVVILSTAIKMSRKWEQIETAQKEAQQAKTEAELKNLRSQMNPHFLLNTLNNIYALAQLNSDRLKPAILDLSRLLQYVLYENNKMFVPLKEEADFIRNYIELVRLRLSDRVTLDVDIEIPGDSDLKIAPLIFISLIENAFKHGVSGDEPSLIEISLCQKEEGTVEFLCKNSYFPKDETDKSGSGIGLRQVEKRLELLYPYRHVWHKKIENGVYSTILIIETKNENDKPDVDLLDH